MKNLVPHMSANNSTLYKPSWCCSHRQLRIISSSCFWSSSPNLHLTLFTSQLSWIFGFQNAFIEPILVTRCVCLSGCVPLRNTFQNQSGRKNLSAVISYLLRYQSQPSKLLIDFFYLSTAFMCLLALSLPINLNRNLDVDYFDTN